MKYDIYFHNDFDGRASAAVLLDFFRSRGDSIEHFVPVDFNIEGQYLRNDFFKTHKLFRGRRNPAIVVDFIYHPRAMFWFDHHETSFKKDSWRRKFKPTKKLVWDKKYQSCCHLVMDSLSNNFGYRPPAHIKDSAKWADVIDGANFRSPKQVLEIKEPAFQVEAFIDSAPQSEATKRPLIEALSKKTLSEIARRPEVKAAVARFRKRVREDFALCRRQVRLIGRVAFLDVGQREKGLAGYVIYQMYPKILYVVLMNTVGKIIHLRVGVNPWLRKKSKIHIGKLITQFGGGGHRGVGATRAFTEKRYAYKMTERIIAILNKKSR